MISILLNDQPILIPQSLDEFTLGERARFQREHGIELFKLLQQAQAIKDKADKEIFEVHYMYESMFRAFSFFTGVDIDVLKQCDFVDEIARCYHNWIKPLFNEDTGAELKRSFSWLDEEWTLPDPELTQGSPMTFGEFIDAKQFVKNIADDGGSKWDYLPAIATIYLRKKGEKYSEHFLYEDSERLRAMEKLPMSIAVQVGFFLSCTTSSSMTISRSSGNPEQRIRVSRSKHISNATGGSIF
jgi:hypothetical protein